MSKASAKRKQKAVGYVRVSRVGGREGDRFISPQLQREQIALAAKREGVEVVDVLEELDASGGDSKRPLWNEAIRRVEAGEVGTIVVWNLSRFSRSVKDALGALDRIREAGGRLVSASEAVEDDPYGRLNTGFMLQLAQFERDRARAGFAASVSSALERGVYMAGTTPLGYIRGSDRRLVPDPDTAPVVLGLFERRAKGLSWVRLARWATEQLADRGLTESGVKAVVRNPAYLGQARYGDKVKDDAHEAIVPRGLWRKCQEPGRKSARSGRLTERFLLQGLAVCASCGRAMYLSGGKRRGKDYEHYICRRLECDDHAYARAEQLDTFVLNRVEELLTGVDYDGRRVGDPADEETWRAATYAPKPGGDDAEVAEAEAALEDAKADLDGFLADTSLRSILGAGKYNETAANFVAVVNKCEADLAEARERNSGSWASVGELWLHHWGWSERREWLERVVRSVTVARGREPLSRRVEVELR
jgi:site-specific DNA recombinase